jgi:hypothetical protein
LSGVAEGEAGSEKIVRAKNGILMLNEPVSGMLNLGKVRTAAGTRRNGNQETR